MLYTLPQYILLFFIYGILGWCAEVAFAGFTTHELVNRGFLNGPVCPIYGFGMVAMLLVVGPWIKNVVVLFFVGMIITTGVELFGGLILYKIFHTRWWDYSNYKWNFHGLICPQFCLVWGVACVVVLRVIHPLIAAPVRMIPPLPLLIVDAVFLVGFVADVSVSAAEAIGLNKHLQQIDELRAAMRVTSDKLTTVIGGNAITADALLDEQKLQLTLAAMEGRDNAADLADQIKSLSARAGEMRAKGEKLLRQRFFGTGRLLRAFPDMKSSLHAESLDAILAHISALAAAAKKSASELKDKLVK